MEHIDAPPPADLTASLLGRLLSLPLVVAVLAAYVLLVDLW